MINIVLFFLNSGSIFFFITTLAMDVQEKKKLKNAGKNKNIDNVVKISMSDVSKMSSTINDNSRL